MMAGWLWTIAGCALLVWTVNDIFSTVFVVGRGAGPQAGKLTDSMWTAALRIHNPESERSHRRLRIAGPCIVFVVLGVWVAQMMLSWALVFGPQAFAQSDVSFGDRFVFAGRTVIGRAGNSPRLDASSGTWEVLHGLAGLSGVAIVSIGLAYVLPVLRGVADKRTAAVSMNALGETVSAMRQMVERADDGGDIDLHLIRLCDTVAGIAELQRAYPVLHYFHSSDPASALAPAIAKVSLLVRNGVPTAPKVDSTVIDPLARATSRLLDGMKQMGLESDTADTGSHSGEGGHPNFPTEQLLRNFVEFDGWTWDVVDP